MAGLFAKAKSKVVAMKTTNPAEVLGSNTRAEMMEIDGLVRIGQNASKLNDRRASISSTDLRHRRRCSKSAPTTII